MRYELSDFEWTAIKSLLPNEPRGVRRVNDRRVLNGIFWVLRSCAPCVARPAGELSAIDDMLQSLRALAAAGVWGQIMEKPAPVMTRRCR